MSQSVIGWDVGGANVKVARVVEGAVVGACSLPFELQRAPGELAPTLRRLAAGLGGEPGEPHAVTMTAELSQLFRTKREGVAFVLDAVARAFPDSPIHVYTVEGRFLAPEAARTVPLDVAASNWAATAAIVSTMWRDCVLIDVGTTTTDIIPIAGGRVVAEGRTDPQRLRTGELVYVGAVRTPVEAIVHTVPLRNGMAGVSAEGFALAGDVHLWRGDLAPEAYTAPTPDGRPATCDFARERLARVVCADGEMLDEAAISAIADHVAEAEVERITGALAGVVDRHPSSPVAVVAGLGAFLAIRAARRLGIPVAELARELGADAARAAPAAAVALLLDRSLSRATS